MAVHVEMNDGKAMIGIEGEMTIFVAQEIKQALQAALHQSEALVLDLSQVSEMDAAGFQLMIAAKMESIAKGKSFRLINHSHAVQDLLEISDLTTYFNDAMTPEAQAA